MIRVYNYKKELKGSNDTTLEVELATSFMNNVCYIEYINKGSEDGIEVYFDVRDYYTNVWFPITNSSINYPENAAVVNDDPLKIVSTGNNKRNLLYIFSNEDLIKVKASLTGDTTSPGEVNIYLIPLQSEIISTVEFRSY